jgi:hypothetical protein
MAGPNFGCPPSVLDLVLFLKNPVATDRGADTIRIVARDIRNIPRREREELVAAPSEIVAATSGMQLRVEDW